MQYELGRSSSEWTERDPAATQETWYPLWSPISMLLAQGLRRITAGGKVSLGDVFGWKRWYN